MADRAGQKCVAERAGVLAFALLRGTSLTLRLDTQPFSKLERAAAPEATRWMRRLARAGYATRGFLYCMIGGLAALTAFGQGGETTDSQGALLEVYRQPFGKMLLVLVAIGLFGHAAFRAYRAVKDPEREATGKFGYATRALWLGIAALHCLLGSLAVRIALGSASRAPGDDAPSKTAEVLSWKPLGPWLVAAGGIALIVAAMVQLWRAWRAKLDEQLDLTPLGTQARGWVVRFSRFGMAARALVAFTTGVFLILASATSDPTRAKGFGESLQALRETPLGAPLLAGVALGLIAFGCYQLVEARYRRVLGRSGTSV